MEKMNVFDIGEFEDAAIIQDDDKLLVMRAIIASEIVQPYQNKQTGKTEFHYKPADELEKATWTAEGRWVKTLSHPTTEDIDEPEDIQGFLRNSVFRKDLLDPKTKRPCRRGIQVDVCWYKDRVPKETLDKARKLELRDNSIGFKCFKDPTPGEWQGQHYDFIQRRIVIKHLAAPIAKGRCPSPYCGINVDSAEQDMWETTAENIRSGHNNPDKFDQDSFRTIDITPRHKSSHWLPKGTIRKRKMRCRHRSAKFPLRQN